MQLRGYFDVMDYGAKGDGSTNDLLSLQAAVDAADAVGGGTVWLGPGVYNIGEGTWKIGKEAAQHHVNIEGINLNATRILCDTSDGHTAIYLNLEKYVTVREFSVINTGTRGGHGIDMGGDLGAGTQTNGNLLQHLYLQNFDHAIDTSGGLGTSSETKFDHCVFSGNNYGFYSSNFNALNFLHEMVEIYDNTIAGLFISTGNMAVIGGASNNNGSDFWIAGGNDGQSKIVGFRAQAPTNTWLISPSDSYVSIEDCIVHPRAFGVEVIKAGRGVSIKNCTLNGHVTISY